MGLGGNLVSGASGGLLGAVLVRVGLDNGPLTKGVAQTRGELNALGRAGVSASSAMQTAMLSGVVAVGAGLAAMTVAGIKALAQWDTINKQTAAVLQSTGSAANITAAQVHTLAQSIEATTSIQAENVQQGENLLLTFTNIRNQVG